MRSGWTMIELIFILVVIGILASISISKLSSTRDDAKLSTDVANMNICIRDTAAIYTATSSDLDDINSNACDKVVCYTIDVNKTHMKVDINVTGDNYCSDIQNVGGQLAKTYRFSGEGISK